MFSLRAIWPSFCYKNTKTTKNKNVFYGFLRVPEKTKIGNPHFMD